MSSVDSGLWQQVLAWLQGLGLPLEFGAVADAGAGVAQAASQLDTASLLALAGALGWASGFRLYAVVFLVGW